MSDLFQDVGSIDYPILDADAHVNEPPDLWQEGVPARWRDRAPRLVSGDKGDVWEFDDGKHKWPMGLTATAGQSFFQFSPTGARYATMRPGSFDTQARLARHGRRRHLGPGAVPERDAARCEASTATTGTCRWPACAPTTSGCSEFCEGLGRAPDRPGHPAHHRPRRRHRRARVGHEGTATGRAVISSFPERLALNPSSRGCDRFWAPRPGGRLRPSPSTSGASSARRRPCTSGARRRRTRSPRTSGSRRWPSSGSGGAGPRPAARPST